MNRSLSRWASCAALPGPRLDHEHGALHGDVAGAVQGHLVRNILAKTLSLRFCKPWRVDTRTIQAYLGHKSIPGYGALHRAGTDSVQKLIPGLTAPAASFEATVGGSGCPRLVEFFKKISMNARWVPFCVEVPPDYFGVPFLYPPGNSKGSPPLSPSFTKRGAPVPESIKIGAPVLPPLKMLWSCSACYGANPT